MNYEDDTLFKKKKISSIRKLVTNHLRIRANKGGTFHIFTNEDRDIESTYMGASTISSLSIKIRSIRYVTNHFRIYVCTSQAAAYDGGTFYIFTNDV